MVTLVSYCSLDLEPQIVKCLPYYLLHEFTSAILTAVYVPPHAEEKSVLDEIYTITNALETEYREALFSVASDFNQTNLKAANLDEYATTDTVYSKCIENCMPMKSIRTCPNQQPWMNQEMHHLLKTRPAVFKSDDLNLLQEIQIQPLTFVNQMGFLTIGNGFMVIIRFLIPEIVLNSNSTICP
eukprot:g38911.t1